MSGEAQSAEIDAIEVERGAGVPAGRELVRFATASLGDRADLAAARAALRDVVGDAGLVEAAGTVAVFEGLNRIADATGIQLDDNLAADTADFRGQLGIDDYSVADGKIRDVGKAERASGIMELFQ